MPRTLRRKKPSFFRSWNAASWMWSTITCSSGTGLIIRAVYVGFWDQVIERTDALFEPFRLGGKKTSLSDELKFVEAIVELQRCLEAWHEVVEALTPLLEHRFAGRQTKWEIVLQDIGDVEVLLNGWPGNRRNLIGLLTGEDDAHRSRELVQTLEAACTEVDNLIQTGLDTSLCDQVKEGSVTLSSLTNLIQDATITVERIEDVVHEPPRNALETIPGLKGFRDLMESGARLKILEREHSQAENALQTDLRSEVQSI